MVVAACGRGVPAEFAVHLGVIMRVTAIQIRVPIKVVDPYDGATGAIKSIGEPYSSKKLLGQFVSGSVAEASVVHFERRPPLSYVAST